MLDSESEDSRSGMIDFGCRLFDHRAHKLTPDEITRVAERWFEQMDGQGPMHIIAVATERAELEATLQAVRISKGRLTAFSSVGGTSKSQLTSIEEALDKQHVRGLVLYPGLHGFRLGDSALTTVLQTASSLRAPIIVRTGLPPASLRDREDAHLDMPAANPLELAPLADKYPLIPFVIEAFGAGFLREALMVGELCENVHLGTAPAGAWRRTLSHPHALEDLFERALGAFGAERLLFSTGSGPTTPGWRSDLATLQREALGALEATLGTRTQIFRRNAQILLDL